MYMQVKVLEDQNKALESQVSLKKANFEAANELRKVRLKGKPTSGTAAKSSVYTPQICTLACCLQCLTPKFRMLFLHVLVCNALQPEHTTARFVNNHSISIMILVGSKTLLPVCPCPGYVQVEQGLANLAKQVEKNAYELTGCPPVSLLTVDQLAARVHKAMDEAVEVTKKKSVLEDALKVRQRQAARLTVSISVIMCKP